jgi:hypothetical protein
MKKVASILSLVLIGFAVHAQTTGSENNMSSDTSHRHHAYHDWNRQGNRDSLHRHHFQNFDRNRGEAMNRFGRGEERNDRFNRFGRHGRFGGEMARMHFSPEQRKQMEAINKEYHKKSADLYKNDNLTLREYKSQLLALQKEKKTKLQGLLTTDQINKMAEWKKQREENAQVMAAAHLERMKIHLKLTDQQASTIKTQEQNTWAQIKSVRENDNLMRDQKMEQIKTLMAKQKEAIKSVLTPEQVTEMENMHKNRFGAK